MTFNKGKLKENEKLAEKKANKDKDIDDSSN